ncbi:protein YgfX [Enterobacteriaceae bacterium LUAb1]
MDRCRSELRPSRLGKHVVLAFAALVMLMLLWWWPSTGGLRTVSLLVMILVIRETCILIGYIKAVNGTLRLLERGELQWKGERWFAQSKPLIFSWGLFLRLRSEQGRSCGLWLMQDALPESEWRGWRRELLHQNITTMRPFQ